MAGKDLNRDLINKILEDSDDEDEIDKVINSQIKKSNFLDSFQKSKLLGEGENERITSGETFSTNPKGTASLSAGSESSGSTIGTGANRYSFSNPSKKKKDSLMIDKVLQELADDEDSSDEEIDINKLLGKDFKKNQFERDLQNKLNMDFSDSSDDDAEDSTNFRDKLGIDQTRKDEEEEKRMAQQVSRMDLIDIIEQNEKKTEEHKSYAVFQYDKNYYNIHTIEQKLLDQQRLTEIAKYIYSQKKTREGFEGLPYCIKQYKNLVFIGISQGAIRIFDIQNDEELKPLQLKKNKTIINRVLSIDVSLNGDFLIAGYADGNLALFDLTKNKLIIEINDVHHHEIRQVKFLSIESPITILSGDSKGILYKVSITKTFLIYSYKSDLIMKKPFKDFWSLSTLQPYPKMPKEVSEWHTHNIVAFSNTEELSVAVLGKSPRKLFSISRNEFAHGFVEQGNLCFTDWGYGITPRIFREKAKCLLAVAWGKVLQIYVLENPDKGMSGIRQDGYYICDSPID